MDLAELRQRVAAGERFEYLLFWGHQPRKDGSIGPSCLSQWFPAPFDIDGVRYLTSEHWMMAGKAQLFGDEETLAKILESPHPGAAKSLGRQVRGFDQAGWMAVARRIVTEGNIAKFRQNPTLREYLLGTGSQVIVEASPHDPVWGIGLAADDPLAKHPASWRGENLLGFALMDARDVLHE
ncbi:MAG: NADAR family protein [Pirellulales bacterium]|nr:NADAR family protein [Pirellulales bacterium]